MRVFVLVILLCGLTGCSGGTAGDGLPRRDQAAALEAALAEENISAPSALPTRGTATYVGFMTLGLPIGGAAQDYVGDLDMGVDFGAIRNQVSGSASNFNGLTGTLTLAGGDLDRTTDPNINYTFDGALTGTLAQSGNRYNFDGSIVGEFRGRNQDGLTGVVLGDINGLDGQDLFDGSIAATRDN
ncbi:MAG: hypothetical protein P8P56_05820 [Yoonia sp.]|nr:hypothetical protein [Yoonia sp.]